VTARAGTVLCEWGMAGLVQLRERAAVIVVVDVLSFSTAVDVAVSRGAAVLPFASDDREAARREAERRGALLAEKRRPGGAGFSLSPGSLRALQAGAMIVLPSPNGGRLSCAGNGVPMLAGCLRNAGAVAAAAREIAGATGTVAVIPAGERWTDGSLRPAIEDWLGAGAIIAALDAPCVSEARLASDSFRVAGSGVGALIWDCVSGRELCERGFAEDVEIALEQDVSGCVPVLRDAVYRRC